MDGIDVTAGFVIVFQHNTLGKVPGLDGEGEGGEEEGRARWGGKGGQEGRRERWMVEGRR